MYTKSEETARSLSDSINIATRPVHAKLNKLVIYRLPLAIPPRADDPSDYVSGLLHITPVYTLFESLWQNISDTPLPPKNSLEAPHEHSCAVCDVSPNVHHTPNRLDAPHRPSVCTRIHALLAHLHTPDLVRTEALKADIQSMTGWSAPILEEHLSAAAESHILSAFLTSIRQSVQARPQVLLAYAWVLYMALFSGGRFIRASLARVEPSFWTSNVPLSTSFRTAKQSLSSIDEDELPLRFFTFDTPEDGENLKQEFKRRLAESESLLTDQERADIVEEAKRIFGFMVEVVSELDSVCGTQTDDTTEDDSEGLMGRFGRLLGLRTRDSVVVAKERAWGRLLKGHQQDSDAITDNGSASDEGDSGCSSNGEDVAPHGMTRKICPDHVGQKGKANGEHVRFQRTH